MNGNPSTSRRSAVRTALPPAALAVCLVLTTACAGLVAPMLKEPSVDLEGAELVRFNLQQADLLFDFRVDNPNGVNLPLAGIDYELFWNGTRLLEGAQDRRIDIAAHGTSRVELPVTVRYEDLIAAFRGLRDRRRSDYQIRAGFLFDVPLLGRVRVPVEEAGDLALPGFASR
jgi:LEA14-like dessication related protein